MKRLVCALCCVAIAFGLSAEDKGKNLDWLKDPKRKAKLAQVREKYRGKSQKEIFEMHTGGYVIKPDSGSGCVAFVNAQKHLDAETVRSFASSLELLFRIRIKVVAGDAPTLGTAAGGPGRYQAAAVVYLVDDGNLPRSLVSYEENWGIVNLGGMSSEPRALAVGRAEKIMFRTFSLVAGLADAPQIGSTMWPVKKESELDALWLPDKPLPNLVGPISRHLERLGVQQTTVTTYQKACQEGWAQTPTNDIQKAIWDKVHAIPDKPMKITYDTDKQKPVVK